jgi:hypothetical protein
MPAACTCCCSQVIVVNRVTDPQLQQAEGEAVAAVAQAAQYGDVQKVQVGCMKQLHATLLQGGSRTPYNVADARHLESSSSALL